MTTAKLKNTFADLHQLIALHSQLEECLKTQVSAGFMTECEAGGFFHDYLNETSGLFDDEYLEIKEIVMKEGFLNPSFDYNPPKNSRDLLHAASDAHDEISFLSRLWEELKCETEGGLITDHECRNRFSNILADRGINHETFENLCDIEWVEFDE